MIQADTIRTGSACTVPVADAYWLASQARMIIDLMVGRCHFYSHSIR
ncbi:MAG TPA: hypothetical protein VLW50_00215 [Streptosporangiaceae bacterium]|nr:hypothetical protein [Streptosporangiaceae bacterium]